MTPSTTVKLSMNPFTATRNILLVVALYSVRNTVFSCPIAELFAISVAGSTMENDLRTSGESSLSTCSACMADEASLSVGRGRSMTLQTLKVSSFAIICSGQEPTMSRGTQGPFQKALSLLVMRAAAMTCVRWGALIEALCNLDSEIAM